MPETSIAERACLPQKRQSNERSESDIGRADGLQVPVYGPLLFPYVSSLATMVTIKIQASGWPPN